MKSKDDDNLRLLFELIKGARRSDRELAKVLGKSQPTITRRRTLLEKQKMIQEYTVVPDLFKMGFEIMAFTFMSFSEFRPELFRKAREWTDQQPWIIFSADGEGLGMNACFVSVHKNYSSYSKLLTQIRQDWQPNLKDVQSFVISLARGDLFIKQFSFRTLEKVK